MDSSTTDSSRDAQAEIRNRTAKNETAYAAKRGIIGTNLARDAPDASPAVSGRFGGRHAGFGGIGRRAVLRIQAYPGSATSESAKSEARTANG